MFSPFLSGLADAATGKKFWHIPYRESVLTKLLQSALGGNSKTTLVQAVFHTAPGAIVTLRGPAIPTSPPCHLPATVLTLAFAQSSSFSTRSVHCCLLFLSGDTGGGPRGLARAGQAASRAWDGHDFFHQNKSSAVQGRAREVPSYSQSAARARLGLEVSWAAWEKRHMAP